MIVAVICDVLGEENNGTTIAAMNLIRTLRAKGHQVPGGQPRCQPGRGAGALRGPHSKFGDFQQLCGKNGVSLAKQSVPFWKRLWMGWMWCM